MNLFEIIIIILWIIGVYLALAVWLFRRDDKAKANRSKETKSEPEVFDPKVVAYVEKKVTVSGAKRDWAIRNACQYFQKEYDAARLDLVFRDGQIEERTTNKFRQWRGRLNLSMSDATDILGIDHVSATLYDNNLEMNKTTELACIAVEYLYLHSLESHGNHPAAAYYCKRHFFELLNGIGLKKAKASSPAYRNAEHFHLLTGEKRKRST